MLSPFMEFQQSFTIKNERRPFKNVTLAKQL